jgi:hypothetical protein
LDCEEFLEEMEKEFRKARKALDTYSLQECDAAVKKRISECQLRMEMAHQVVQQMLKDNEAWRYRPRESRRRERQMEDEPAPREVGSRKTEPPTVACHKVRFESGLREERKTVTADMHVGGTCDFRTARDTGHATSTLANSNQNQELSKEFRWISTMKGIQLVLEA